MLSLDQQKAVLSINMDTVKQNEVQPYTSEKCLTEETMCQSLRRMQYAVRGQVVIAADRIQKEIRADPRSHPAYDHVVYTNIGKEAN